MPASAAANTKDEYPTGRKVWDGPVRILHWSLTGAILVSWWTGRHGQLDYHIDSGYVILWIVLMRLYWGIVGSSTARFSHFLRGPGAIFHHIRTLHRRDTPATFGHNALGAMSVVALLALVLAMVGLGLFSVDVDGLYSGPLSDLVSFQNGRAIARWHHWLFTILEVAIAVHVGAIFFYWLYKRHNLVVPMLSGKASPGTRGEEMVPAPLWRFAAGGILFALIIWAMARGTF